MKKVNAVKKSVATSAPVEKLQDSAVTYGPRSIVVFGREYPCEYSVTQSTMSVCVFVRDFMPGMHVKYIVRPESANYAAALAAATPGMTAEKPAEKAPAAPVKKPAAKAEKPAAKKAEKPAAKAPAAPVKKPAEKPAAKKAEKPAAKPAEKPVKKPAVQPAAKAEKPAEKPAAATVSKADFVGTEIAGKGWKIVFDAEMERTRVIFDGQASAKQIAAVENARFFWSPTMGSYNKHLTVKAYKAALELAAALKKIAA